MDGLASTISRNWCRTLLAIFLAAFLIRVVFILSLQDGFYFPDSVTYSAAAVSLLTAGELGVGYNRPPGYPVFLAVIYGVFGESIVAIRLVESFIGAILAVIIASIGRRIAGAFVGALAGALWSVYPLGVFVAGLVYPTNVLATILATTVLCLLPENKEKISSVRVFLAGVLGGVGALMIPIVLATVLAISVWLLYWGGARRFLLAGLIFLGAAVTVVPWMIRDFYVYQRLVFIEPRLVKHLPRMPGVEKTERDKKVRAIVRNPGKFASRFGREFYHFWQLYPDRITMDRSGLREKTHRRHRQVVKATIISTNTLITAVSVLSTGPLFLFAIIGSAAMWLQQKRRRDCALLWATILSFAVGYSLFVAKMRYRIPIEPYIAILAAYGIVWICSALAAVRSTPWRKAFKGENSPLLA